MSCWPLSHASQGRSRPWLTCLSLLLCLTACAGPVPTSPPIDPPPASLAAPCWPGPAWPEGEGVTLGVFVEVALQREAAAAECRAKQSALVRAWPGSDFKAK